jgi:hypothetical protein
MTATRRPHLQRYHQSLDKSTESNQHKLRMTSFHLLNQLPNCGAGAAIAAITHKHNTINTFIVSTIFYK